jgi:hypothetical protein
VKYFVIAAVAWACISASPLEPYMARTDSRVEDIVLTPDTLALAYVDEGGPLVVTCLNQHANPIRCKGGLKWTVRDTTKVTNIVTTTETAWVKARAMGTTWVVVRDPSGRGVDSSKITVTTNAPAPIPPTAPESIWVAFNRDTIEIDSAQTDTARAATYNNAGLTLVTIGRTLGTTSTHTDVVTASPESGVSPLLVTVTGVTPGTGRIIAASAYPGKPDTVVVIVNSVLGPPPDTTSTPPVATCPASPVYIAVGENWQSKVNANAVNTKFCIRAGVHHAQTVTPKNGQEFWGEEGAIMDGDSTTAHAFVVTGAIVSNVKIKHLEIRDYRPGDGSQLTLAAIYATNGHNWVIDSNEVHHIHGTGIRFGYQGSVRGNLVHDIAGVGISYYGKSSSGHSRINDSIFIKGNTIYNAPSVVISETGELARQSSIKIAFTNYFEIDSNTIYNGVNKGIWPDTDNRNGRIYGNVIHDMGQACIWHEAGYSTTIRRNTLTNCGNRSGVSFGTPAAIQLTNSSPVTIDTNTIVNGKLSFGLMRVVRSSGNYYNDQDAGDGNQGLKDLVATVRGNTITMTSSTGRAGRTPRARSTHEVRPWLSSMN